MDDDTSDTEDSARGSSNELVVGDHNINDLSESEEMNASSEDQAAVVNRQAVFDTNLPTMHQYLGRLNSVSGYTIFDDGECITVPAIHTNTIISPGFTLPLVLDLPTEQEAINKCIAEERVFALIFENDRRGDMFLYGTIMQVFESFTKQGIMYLKAKARQRCKVLRDREMRYIGGRLIQVTVKALPEFDVISPLSCTQLLSLKAVRPYCIDEYKHFVTRRKHRQYHMAQFAYPSWVYNHNEVMHYCTILKRMLEKFHVEDSIPSDPALLSFWFLQNYQLLYVERLAILKESSVLERLKLAYTFMLLDRVICCRTCQRSLADHDSIFAMSKDGVQSTYCNPGGYVYETITTLNIRNYSLSGSSSTEFSWFPGYAWTIVQCETCRSHIGWRFTSPDLQPSTFYGLARSSLDIKILPVLVSDRLCI